MEKIVYLEAGSIADPRRPAFDHARGELSRLRLEQVIERLGEATIAIINKPLTAATVDALP